ncbi:hypothetical protein L2E82_46733 [Cichorium intybus]|uniref:Uncharacterized protein n=1 Tax=Cichorium intybus TaxID=13427 RepID=A0ACB8YTP0_CICIN|nr:hypothetical protein L2E82_46733 [Cichorium intybus]
MGINLKDARVEAENIIGRGSGFVAVEIPFTPRTKRALELSLEVECQLGHKYIGSKHLLLGLLREGEGVAARVLQNLVADLDNICTQAETKLVSAVLSLPVPSKSIYPSRDQLSNTVSQSIQLAHASPDFLQRLVPEHVEK